MDVQLYVYDLSQGLARAFSRQFLGIQIDAVYHTSIVLEGIEYFFGHGIQTSYAGATHHGQPMERILLGKTEIPMEVILEYLDSLRGTYTAESYDLFLNNCNNFSHDLATFLVGRGIPDHITSLPQTVLNTPFGQMMRPALDRSMREITQAPVAQPPATYSSQSNAPQELQPIREEDLPAPAVNVTHVIGLPALSNNFQHFVYLSSADSVNVEVHHGQLPKKGTAERYLMDLELNYDREPPDMHDHSFEDLSHYLEREFRYLRNLDSHHSTDEAWATLVPLRIALRYKCVASYFAEHHDAHVGDVDRRWVDYAETGLQVFMKYINGFDDKAPHKLRLAFLKMCCNLFNTHLCRWILTSSFIDGMINVCVDTLLRLPIEYATMEPESPIDIEMRIHLAAARLACNIAATDAIGWVPHIGVDGQLPTIRKLSQSNRLELTAALIHALTQDVAQLGVLREKGPVPEDAKIYNTTDVLMRALGWFLFSEWKDGSGYELRELCKIYTIGEVLDVLEGIARFDALAKELKMLVFRIE